LVGETFYLLPSYLEVLDIVCKFLVILYADVFQVGLISVQTPPSPEGVLHVSFDRVDSIGSVSEPVPYGLPHMQPLAPPLKAVGHHP
jgi:hypothetical protein